MERSGHKKFLPRQVLSISDQGSKFLHSLGFFDLHFSVTCLVIVRSVLSTLTYRNQSLSAVGVISLTAHIVMLS